MDQDEAEFEQLLGEIPRATSAPPQAEETYRCQSSSLLSIDEDSSKPFADIGRGDGSPQASTHLHSHEKQLIYSLSQQQQQHDLACSLGSLSLNSSNYHRPNAAGMMMMMMMPEDATNGERISGASIDHYLLSNLKHGLGGRVSRSSQFGAYAGSAYNPHPHSTPGDDVSSFPSGLVCDSRHCAGLPRLPDRNPFAAPPHERPRNPQLLQEQISLQEKQFPAHMPSQVSIPGYTILPISRMHPSLQPSSYQPCLHLASHSQPLLYKQHQHLFPTSGHLHPHGCSGAAIPASDPFNLPQGKGIYCSNRGYCCEEKPGCSAIAAGEIELAQFNFASHQLPPSSSPSKPFPPCNYSNPFQSSLSGIRSNTGNSSTKAGSLPIGGQLPFFDHKSKPSLHPESQIDPEPSILRQLNPGTSPLQQQPRYTSLKEIHGQIYSIAKDQHGCRFLQRKFDEGNEEDITTIFCEISSHIVELMTDPFGNYLIQKLLEVCTESQHMQILLAVTEKSELVSISLNTHGTRAVQKLIETLTLPEQVDIVIMSLQQGAVTLIKDINGNHVIQRCLQHLSNTDSQFIFDAAASHCVEIATHRHGCCVLQRCVDFASGPQRDRLVSEIATNALVLSQDPYGNYVVQYILDLNILWASNELMVRLGSNYSQLAMQKFSSNVVEKCLKLADEENKARIIQELRTSSCLGQLLRHEYANYVIQCALSVSKGALHTSLVEALRPHFPSLRNSPYGKRILSRTNLKKMQFVRA